MVVYPAGVDLSTFALRFLARELTAVAVLVAAAVEVQWESGCGAGCEPRDHP